MAPKGKKGDISGGRNKSEEDREDPLQAVVRSS